jgi:hypothetical protein
MPRRFIRKAEKSFGFRVSGFGKARARERRFEFQVSSLGIATPGDSVCGEPQVVFGGFAFRSVGTMLWATGFAESET